MNWKQVVLSAMVIFTPGIASAQAQTAPAKDTPWSVEFGIGWDNSISGNINSGAIGTLEGVTTVITKNTYEDVYGTGLNMRFGGGYMLNEVIEARATFTFQSLDADLVRMGDIGNSNLYGQYTDYQAFSLDVGMRRYGVLSPSTRAYGEGLIGLGFVDKTDITFAAPGANLVSKVNDFYDQTAAFTFGGNAGIIVQMNKTVGVFGQLGVRYVTGMSQVDDLVGSGLETINDKSARWTMPFIVGVRARF